MFFLISHMLVGQYYPRFLTQIIIGCSFYVLSYLIIKGVFSNTSIDHLKYYALSIAAIDATFIIFKSRNKTPPEPIGQEYNSAECIENPNIYDSTMASEMNDFKVTHDFTFDNSDDSNSMFSTSDSRAGSVAIVAEDEKDK